MGVALRMMSIILAEIFVCYSDAIALSTIIAGFPSQLAGGKMETCWYLKRSSSQADALTE